MTPIEINDYQADLLAWYRTNKRVLPWRLTSDPYLIWISEVMLQQTQVISAIPYYSKFVNAFPAVKDLADADLQVVLKLWEGLGYYSRARNMHKAAKIIAYEKQSVFPVIYNEIIQLPGIGPYIAAAVSSIAFQLPYAVLDGNVKRVIARLDCSDIPVNDPKANKHYQKRADDLLFQNNSGDYNQAVMELGALVCRPQVLDCKNCPVNKYCKAFESNQTSEYPIKIARKKVKTKEMVSLIFEKDDQLWMIQNEENALLGGLWSFPQFEVRNNESINDILDKIILKSTKIIQREPIQLPPVTHTYTHFKENIIPVVMRVDLEAIRVNGLSKAVWVSPEMLKKLPITGACKKILQQHKKYKTNKKKEYKTSIKKCC